MQRPLTNVNYTIGPNSLYFFVISLIAYFLPASILLAQVTPKISIVNGLEPGCATEEQAFNLTINGSDFSTESSGGAVIRIRGTSFTGEVLITPELPKSATKIQTIIQASSIVVSNSGTLTIDIQQPDTNGKIVFSNAVQLPVYPKTGAISGAVSVCGNMQYNYSVAKLPGAASYEWSVISGNATIISGSTANTARVSFTNNAETVKLAVKTINSCGTFGTSSMLDVLVKVTPTVSLPAFSNVCDNAPSIILTGGIPAGGTYAVNGVMAPSFDPATAGVGEHTITYYFTQNGCTANASQIISVLPAPKVTFSASQKTICINAPPLILTGGSPSGGLYSGPGVTGTSFNPAVAGIGKHVISYTFNQSNCTSTATQTIEVLPAPTVDLPVFKSMCIYTPGITLNSGTPAGGTYAVDGVLTTIFDPATAGVGEHTITYFFTQNGCTSSASQTVKVMATPNAIFPVNLQPVCVNAKPVQLSGEVFSGGVFSGAGVLMDDDLYQSVRFAAPNNNFSYNIPVNNSQYTVILHFADNNWTEPGQRSFDVSIEGRKVLDNYDIIDKAGAKTATTETFTVNTNDRTINIDFIGLTSEGGKSDPTVCAIEVKSTTTPSEIYRINAGGSQVSYAGMEFAEDNFFSGGDPFIFSNPVGGTPSTFDPFLAGVGDHTITYTVSKNGCINSASQSITVLDLPVAHISAPPGGTQVCQGTSVTLTATPVANAKYQWLLNGNPIAGALNSTFDAKASGSYTVQVTGNNCNAVSNAIDVVVLTPANIITDQSEIILCAGSQIILHALTGNDYQYQWYLGGNILSNQINSTLSVNQPGDYKVILTPAGCAPITSASVKVKEIPSLINNIISTANDVICTGSTIEFTGSSVSGGTGEYVYQWQSSINNGPYSVFDITETGPNFKYFSDTFTGSISLRRIVVSGSCLSISNEVKLTVNQVISNNTITNPTSDAICPESTPGTITGNIVTDVSNFTYAWESSRNNEPFTLIPGADKANYKPDILTLTTTYRRVITSGQCTNISNTVTIEVKENINGNIISTLAEDVCSNSEATIITGNAVTGGNGIYSYVWERSINGAVFTQIPNINSADYNPGRLTRTTTFRRIIISGGCKNISNELTIQVNNRITGNTITVSSTSICSNSTPGTITGGPVNGGDGNFSYIWESSPDGVNFDTIPNITTSEYNPGPLTQTTTYRRVVTSGACTDISKALTIIVEPMATYTVFLTVLSSDYPVCGQTTYTAKVIKNVDVVNYPADPHYQQVTWMGGEDVTSKFSFDWWKNDNQSVMTGNTSGTLTLGDLKPGDYYTVRAQPASVISACTIINNRPDLIVPNSGASLLFSNRIYLGQPDVYAVSVTSDVLGPVCPGTSVTYTATPNDPGYVNQSYQWIVNGQNIPGATQSIFTSDLIKNGDIVSVRFSSDENSCTPISADNPITMESTEPVENRIEKINAPEQTEVGQPATFKVTSADNTLPWTYRWTILFGTNPEPSTETTITQTPELIIPSVRSDMVQIGVEQLAPAGSCVDALISSRIVVDNFIPLPVTLIYLKAKKQAQGVILLEWVTAMEKNNEGFEVQVSEDAVSFRTLGFIPSQNGNSNIKQEYTFIDKKNSKYGTYYYRLKQIDIDGAFKYFGPVTVKVGGLAERVIAYPNPFLSEITLEIDAPEPGNMDLIMVNAIGSTVMEQTLKIKRGRNKEVLLLHSGLPLGLYTVIMQMNGSTNHIKIIKK